MRPPGWLAAAACLLLAAPRAPGAEPTAQEILAQLTAQRDAWENVVVEATWEELYDGVLTGWEEQTFVWDSLGRRRVTYEHGKYLPDGRRAKKSANDAQATDTTFDGELVAYQQYFPDRDRVGHAVKTASARGGYRTAIIADPQAPLRRDLESHRNPMEYLRRIAIRELDRAVRENRVSSVRASGDDGRAYEVGWAEPSSPKSPAARSALRVNASRGWSPERLRSYAADDRLVRSFDFEYQRQPNGLWTPSRGSHKHWGAKPADGPPAFEWRFTAKRFVVNDPAFRDEVYALRLQKDTAVADTRYNVNYRVGADGALKADLTRLVDRARADEAAVTGRPAAAASPLSARWVWVAANAVLITGIAAYFLRSEFRRRAAAKPTPGA